MTLTEGRGILSVEKRIAISNTFEELAVIATDIIVPMQKPVGIVCGPITSGGRGTMEANIAEFEKQIIRLQNEGKSIFNQMPFEPRMQEIKLTPYYKPEINHLLTVFYGSIFNTDLIQNYYFIQGWNESYGANWEHTLVKQIGGTIFYL